MRNSAWMPHLFSCFLLQDSPDEFAGWKKLKDLNSRGGGGGGGVNV